MANLITEEIKNRLVEYFKTHFPTYVVRECIFERYDYSTIECNVLSTSSDIISVAYWIKDNTISHENLSETCSFEEDETDIAWDLLKSHMYDEDVTETQYVVY